MILLDQVNGKIGQRLSSASRLSFLPFFLLSLTTATAAQNDIILNEFNTVGSGDYLDGSTSVKADDSWGRLKGNGQDWLEFLVVQDNLDLRGYQLTWSYSADAENNGSGALTFSQNPLWSNLRQGMLITVTEWQEAWYNDTGKNNNFSQQGGVNGLGNLRDDIYDPVSHEKFVDFSTDTAFNPDLGDYHINVQAGERSPQTGDFRHFDFGGSIVNDGVTSNIRVDNDAGLFVVNSDSWQMTILDSGSTIVQGPLGEKAVGWAGSGINAEEIGKYEGTANSLTTYQNTTLRHYNDGETSTFGLPNRGTGYNQNLTGLRTWFSPANIVQRNSTTSGLTFGNGTSWSSGVNPSASQEAVFDQNSPSPYTVHLDDNENVNRVLVRNDKVDIDLQGHTLTTGATADYEASVVGQSNGDVAELTLSGSGTFSAGVLNVAENAGSSGSLSLSDTGTTLLLQKGLFVGGRASVAGGTGSVTVNSGTNVLIRSTNPAVQETLKVFNNGSLSNREGPDLGGAITVGSGTVETNSGTIRINSTGVLDVRGGHLSTDTIRLNGGSISGYGSIASDIRLDSSSTIFTPEFDDGMAGSITLSGEMTGANGFDKSGDGILFLTGNNTFGGSLTIHNGLVRADDGVGVSPNTTLRIRQGRLEASGNIHRPLGTGAGHINWSDSTDSGSGGFSAVGGPLTVNLGGAATQVAWGAGNFISGGQRLHFNSEFSDAAVTFVNPINLGTTGSNAREIRIANNPNSDNDMVIFSGVLSQSGGSQGINKSGQGTLELTAANTYSGPTTLDNGKLRAIDGVGIPADSVVRLRGGILETSGTFNRALGTGSNQVNWNDGIDSGEGGFAAQGENLTVNLGGAAETLIWGAANFIQNDAELVFGSGDGTHVVTWENPLNLGNTTDPPAGPGARELRITDNGDLGTDLAVMTGVISSTGGTHAIEKEGDGTLVLVAANTYAGTTTIEDGALRAIDGVGLPTSSVLRLRGGVWEGNGTFNRNVGIAVGNVNWKDAVNDNDGGFAAQGGNLIVTLNSGAAQRWGSGSFVSTNDSLLFGSNTSDAIVNFTNPIDLGLGTVQRTVKVANNPHSTTDWAELSGVLSGTAGLNKTGAGELVLSAANTYTGSTNVNDGTLTITGSLASTVIVDTDAMVGGNGQIIGNLINLGRNAPGNSPGTLTVDGNYTQTTSGTLEIELVSGGGVAGTDYDRLAVTGSAILEGTLDLLIDPKYVPVIGHAMPTVVSADAVSGIFDSVNNVVISGQLGLAVTYTESSVDVQIARRGNTDVAKGDPDVDTGDLTKSIINFTSASGSGKTWAEGDTDGDGDVDTGDLTTSIINFTGAQIGSANTVPEPGSLLLFLLGGLLVLVLRRQSNCRLA